MKRVALTVRTADGRLVDVVSRERALAWTPGAFVPGVERALAELAPGERRTVRVPAADAYGPHDPSLVRRVPLHAIPARDLRPGDVFRTGPEPDAPFIRVLEVGAEDALLDANHPLAGVDLVFDLEVLA